MRLARTRFRKCEEEMAKSGEETNWFYASSPDFRLPNNGFLFSHHVIDVAQANLVLLPQ
jgi:hypothetical protein